MDRLTRKLGQGLPTSTPLSPMPATLDISALYVPPPNVSSEASSSTCPTINYLLSSQQQQQSIHPSRSPHKSIRLFIHIANTGRMNQTAEIAKGLLVDPPQELRELMDDPRTTDEARQAVAELTSPPASQPTSSTTLGAPGALPSTSQLNGSSVAAVKDLTNRSGDGRLQIVNETQEFTYVDFYSSRFGYE